MEQTHDTPAKGLPGDVEVLTENGFVRLDSLSQTVKVAQIDVRGEISWVVPQEYIQLSYSGDLITFDSKCVTIPIIANHSVAYRSRAIFRKRKRRTSGISRKSGLCLKRMFQMAEAHTFLKDSQGFYIAAGGQVPGAGLLSDFQKFQIAYAADGTLAYVHKRTPTEVVRFALTKRRKQKELERLVISLGFKYVKSKPHCRKGRKGSEPYIQYDVTVPKGSFTKDITQTMPLTSVTSALARGIIAYLPRWDGAVCGDGRVTYSSTKLQEVDYAQALCALCGKQSRVHTITPKAAHLKLAYTIFILDKSHTELRQKHVHQSCYEGMVYGIIVSAGMFIARYGKSTFVTGDCS
jgi:hypothetical protein